MRKFLFTGLLALTVALPAIAQSAKWEMVPTVFAANYMGDLVSTLYPALNETQVGAGLSFRRNLSESWALRPGVTYSSMSGSDANYPEQLGMRGFSFTSQVGEASLLLEFDLRGSERYEKGYIHRTWSPYLFAGAGLTYYQAKADFNHTETPLTLADRQKDQGIAMVLPFGAGLRYDLTARTTLAAEAGMRQVFSDYIDGVSRSANPDDRDWYMHAGLTLSFRLGRLKDSDGDKVFDRYDHCPAIPGEQSLDGCPDTDGDGIIDEKDDCPYQRGTVALLGCPDRDADGTPDKLDRCPETQGLKWLLGCPDMDRDSVADLDDECPDAPGFKYTHGCPDADMDSIPDHLDLCPAVKGLVVNKGCPDKDTDGDGVVDRLDQCPERIGLRIFDGCPDSDGDGVVDSKDQCPDKAGLLTLEGCPDTDGDGIADHQDVCPDKSGPAHWKGCPDTDGDGVADHEDRCPTLAGVATHKGCPEIKKEELKVLTLAMTGVKFDVGKSVLRKESFSVLDNVAALMIKYPSYILDIRGHTDSDGNDDKNLALSDARAKACLQYLGKKGVDATRMKAAGFGETKPIAPNTTKANKAQNRRVEFEMMLPDATK